MLGKVESIEEYKTAHRDIKLKILERARELMDGLDSLEAKVHLVCGGHNNILTKSFALSVAGGFARLDRTLSTATL